jgi:alkanesulfonate monooxygenase SsuD/methylene tetrahydromethanopterin reductase-like flavin-dependent oxidoreductase (luciferase family)
VTEPNLDVFVEALPPRLQIDYGVRAEERGFRAAWFPEITFGDAFGPATAVATRTERLELGTGVVGIWSRSPVTMALQAATLNELSGGRLLLGLGLQARGYVEGWHGQRYERPVRAMREFVTILRRILSGEAVTFEGEIFSVRGFQLQMQPPEPAASAAEQSSTARHELGRPVRIYMAAIGPQMSRLAGELADGILGYCYSLPYLRDTVLPNLRAGAERGGRSLDGFDIACGFPAIVTPDESGLEQIKGQVMMFATAGSSSPEYASSFAAAGYDVGPIQERVDASDIEGALGLVSDEMADALTIAGSPANVHRRIEEYRDAGLTTIALNPSPPGVWFPLYQGHFPDAALAQIPEFSFPAYLGVIDATLGLEMG